MNAPTGKDSGGTGVDVESQEFATVPVPRDHRVGWIRVGLISAMVAFSLPTFVTGAEVLLATDNARGMAAVLIGCVLLTLIGSITVRHRRSATISAPTCWRVSRSEPGVRPL